MTSVNGEVFDDERMFDCIGYLWGECIFLTDDLYIIEWGVDTPEGFRYV